MSMVVRLRYGEAEKGICPPETVWFEVVSRVSSLRASVLVEVIYEVQVRGGDVLVEEVVGRQ